MIHPCWRCHLAPARHDPPLLATGNRRECSMGWVRRSASGPAAGRTTPAEGGSQGGHDGSYSGTRAGGGASGRASGRAAGGRR